MFELKLGLKRTCDGVTRRDVLRVGSIAALGLSLPRFLELQARASSAQTDREVSCILVWLQGGISHIDSFDPKPEAPEEVRGEFGVDRDQRFGDTGLRAPAPARPAAGQVFDPPLAQSPERVARRG